MGQLAGFRYREIIKRLKQLGFKFDRQAVTKYGTTQTLTIIQQYPIIQAICQKARCVQF